MADDLAGLLAPTSLREFFDHYYEREPLHRSGLPTRGSAILSAEDFRARVRRLDEAGNTAFGVNASSPQTAEALERHLAAGMPLVWDDAVGLSPTIDALCRSLSESFGALVWPNVYSTADAGSPFSMHFDPHETIVVQCDGEKVWHLSSLRARLPLDDAPADDAQARDAISRAADLASQRVRHEWRTTPGDVLYLPRGLFHAAAAASGRSLHVTFGIRPPVGFDLVPDAPAEIRDDPLFREYLPGPAADPDGAAARAQLDRLRSRLEELGLSSVVRDDLAARRRTLLEQSSRPAAVERSGGQ